MAYFDTKSVLPAVMGALAEKAPKGLRPFLPSIKVLANQMTGMGVVVANTLDGIQGDAYSPVGGPFWLVTLASMGSLTKPRGAAKVAQTMAQIGRVQTAIQRFREQSGRYPTTLGELVPMYLKKVPTDPFSPDHSEIG